MTQLSSLMGVVALMYKPSDTTYPAFNRLPTHLPRKPKSRTQAQKRRRRTAAESRRRNRC